MLQQKPPNWLHAHSLTEAGQSSAQKTQSNCFCCKAFASGLSCWHQLSRELSFVLWFVDLYTLTSRGRNGPCQVNQQASRLFSPQLRLGTRIFAACWCGQEVPRCRHAWRREEAEHLAVTLVLPQCGSRLGSCLRPPSGLNQLRVVSHTVLFRHAQFRIVPHISPAAGNCSHFSISPRRVQQQKSGATSSNAQVGKMPLAASHMNFQRCHGA